MTLTPPALTEFFYEVTPERVLTAVESLGVRCTGRVLALNSLENRVYEVELDIEDPETLPSKWDAFRIVKFYRPGRWSREQIEEEHSFLKECIDAELPVVAPIPFPDGTTLKTVPGLSIQFAVFPKVGGRILDEMSRDQLLQVGRMIARLHAVGGRAPHQHRMTLSVDTLGRANLQYLNSSGVLPASIQSYYNQLAERLFAAAEPWFADVKYQRIHGDCHIGNILWSRDDVNMVDFDDSFMGPCVQDLWLLTPGRDEDSLRRREVLLEGYESMRDFDRSTLRLIEPLRALRMIHFSAWIAKRYDDPAFKRVFVDFGTEGYWREQLIALQEVGEVIGVG
jgi:Ser/Thr protein kinase RdoA (MazF antagonist)